MLKFTSPDDMSESPSLNHFLGKLLLSIIFSGLECSKDSISSACVLVNDKIPEAVAEDVVEPIDVIETANLWL